MNAASDFGFEFDAADDLDLFLALQLQQQLDLAISLSLANAHEDEEDRHEVDDDDDDVRWSQTGFPRVAHIAPVVEEDSDEDIDLRELMAQAEATRIAPTVSVDEDNSDEDEDIWGLMEQARATHLAPPVPMNEEDSDEDSPTPNPNHSGITEESSDEEEEEDSEIEILRRVGHADESDESEASDDDEIVITGHNLPHHLSPISVSSSLDFSPEVTHADLPTWANSPSTGASSSAESLLHSPASTSRVKPTFSCSICLDDHPEDDIARIPVCDHSFGRDCLREYITQKVSEHRYPVFCPVCLTLSEEQRPGTITESLIEELWIPEKEYAIFEDMQLSSLSVLLHCRQCKRSMYVARDEYEADNVIACPLPACTYRWCTGCQSPVPLGSANHTCDTSAGLSAMVRQHGWKFCPGCKVPIQKESGCNHMSCITPGCNVNFCYSCGDTIIRSALVKEISTATMSHYRENCRLFEDIPDVDVPP